MITKQLLILGASMLASTLGVSATAQETQQYIQIAEIEIDPAQVEAYKAAVREHIETAVRVEPGVLALYAVSDQDNPTQVKVFEIYRDVEAYKSHLQSPHFKNYKTATETMVKSLKLVRTDAIALGAKTR